MIKTLKDSIRVRPHLFDVVKAIKRRVLAVQDLAYEFFDAFARSHPGGVRFVQIGANDGLRSDPVREFIIRYRWEGIFVEPLPTVFDLLKTNYAYARNRELIFVNAAISTSDGYGLPFYTFDGAFLSRFPLETQLDHLRKASFDRGHVERHIGVENDWAIRAIEVPSLTMNSLMTKYWRGGQLDLLVIDAEGHEASVLKSMDFKLWHPEAIFFESHNLGEEEGKLSEFLMGRGYALRRLGGDTVAVRR